MTTKYHALHPWLDEILTAIKKDIKTDYLPADTAFCRAHFGNRPINRLAKEEINQAFIKTLLEGHEEMDAWVVNRWVFKHGDVYSHFAERLSEMTDDFNSLEELTEAQSEAILDGAIEKFGAKAVYFFSLLNDVVFPASVLMKLKKQAEESHGESLAQQSQDLEKMDLEKMQERHEREIVRLTEKYESRLSGVLKRYTVETDSLKKQVRALQHKINQMA